MTPEHLAQIREQIRYSGTVASLKPPAMFNAAVDLLAALDTALRENGIMREVLDEALEYFDQRADIIDNDGGQHVPNEAMILATAIKAALSGGAA